MTGLITKTTGSWHTVKTEKGIFNCKIKGNYRVKGFKTTNPVAVGDKVELEIQSDNQAWITNIQERENYIIRKSTKLSKEAQLLAANIDQALLIVTIKHPETPLEFIDRFIITAEAYHIPTVLVFNKIDIYQSSEKKLLKEYKKIYAEIGYQCIELSAITGENLNVITSLLHKKISLIAGNSGVGKSTILNAIDPELNLKTAEISDYHKSGKHTTTYPEMFEILSDSYIIDTPGIKGFGVIDFDENEIGLFFNEIFSTSKYCKFNNCTHTHETKCAVKDAVKKGDIAISRYRSYINILTDKNEKYRPAF